MEISPPPTGTPVNRWTTTKKVANAGSTAAGMGISAAQHFTGASTVALVTAGAAASATGIGLIVTGAVLTLTKSTFSAISAHKSRIHRNNLQQIYDRRNAYACGPVDVKDQGSVNKFEHRCVSEEVLLYVIEKKNAKYHRKVVGAVPVVGLLESVRAIGKKAYKAASGTLGVHRNRAARWLAHHLITHNCGLAQAMVAELYSFEEMLWIKDQDFATVVALLEAKMKST